LGHGENAVLFSTWAGKRLAQRVAGQDAGQTVFGLPIYNSPLLYQHVFHAVRSEVLAPFHRLGQSFLYQWYRLRDEKL
jgi:hypothetical protein